MRDAVTDRLPDVITDRLPGNRPTSRLGRLRVPVIVTVATAGAGLVAAAGKYVFDNRFRTGESQVRKVYALDDGRNVVVLSDVTFVVAAEHAADVTEHAKPGARVGYAVARWSLNGIPTGRLTVLNGNTSDEPDGGQG
jgi:hypothetical protein